MRWGFFLAALSLLLLLACAIVPIIAPLPAQAAPAVPQRQQTEAFAESQFLLLYPDLRQASAPAWLRPGVRLTYNSAFATFARDIDDPTPSGAALIQFDVVAQDRRSVVSVTTMYSTQIQGQPPTGLGYEVTVPGVGAFWFSPQVLAHAEDAAFEDFAVNRLTTDVEGETYDVVRMESTTGRSDEVWEFEVTSGILVFHQQVLYGTDGEKRSGNYMTLAGRRQVKLPWRFGSVPKWVKRGVEIDLAGTQMMDLGGPPYVRLPMNASLRVTKIGSLWSEYSQTISASGQQIAQTGGATGVAQILGGMWLPPEALGVLKAGTVLDRDPLTGLVTRVDEAGSRQIVLSGEGPSYLIRYTYDAHNGRLIGFYTEAHMLAGVQYTELAEE
ncbi:MAG: hypothetical protein U0X20_02640 [Caldilineaceae bacterium]